MMARTKSRNDNKKENMMTNNKIVPNSESYERDVLIEPQGFREYDARWLYPE